MVDSGASRHICADIDVFASYTPVRDDEKVVYLGNSHTTQVLGKDSHTEAHFEKDWLSMRYCMFLISEKI